MKKISKIILLAVLLAVTFSCVFAITTSFAAPSTTNITTTPTGYDSADDVVYVKNGNYVANWGARGEVATFLSTYAQNFYAGDNSFENITRFLGGTSEENAPQSQLYKTLQLLMKNKQTYETSYAATRDLYKYTDCVSNDTSKLSLFYEGTLVNSTWDAGATYNREHTWPNSKGDASGNGENDIMMLRPALPNGNSSRGNKAYGESSGYYDPGVSVRGDCARIMLYVYTRWGNTGSMWGSSGVIESMDVLLKWMEEDPVDTWEMGRNDAVQSITGTRNAFVDYPELAWLLFGETVPTNMTTPSGKNKTIIDAEFDSYEFERAVNDIGNYTTLSDKYQAISKAVTLYNSYTTAEKQLVKVPAKQLEMYIQVYNSEVSQQNKNAQTATNNVFVAMAVTLATALVAGFVIKRIF